MRSPAGGWKKIYSKRKKGKKGLSNFALIELFSIRTGAIILHTVIGGFPSNFVMEKSVSNSGSQARANSVLRVAPKAWSQ